AGSFGYEKEHYDISRQIGELKLFPAIREAGLDTVIVASGFSCRQQIEHFTGRKALHPAELLASLLEPSSEAAKTGGAPRPSFGHPPPQLARRRFPCSVSASPSWPASSLWLAPVVSTSTRKPPSPFSGRTRMTCTSCSSTQGFTSPAQVSRTSTPL